MAKLHIISPNGTGYNIILDNVYEFSASSGSISNGWTKFPSGVLAQWGRTNNTNYINFPIGFNYIPSILATHVGTHTQTSTIISSSILETAAIVYCDGHDVAVATDVFWIAIGQ